MRHAEQFGSTRPLAHVRTIRRNGTPGVSAAPTSTRPWDSVHPRFSSLMPCSPLQPHVRGTFSRGDSFNLKKIPSFKGSPKKQSSFGAAGGAPLTELVAKRAVTSDL